MTSVDIASLFIAIAGLVKSHIASMYYGKGSGKKSSYNERNARPSEKTLASGWRVTVMPHWLCGCHSLQWNTYMVKKRKRIQQLDLLNKKEEKNRNWRHPLTLKDSVVNILQIFFFILSFQMHLNLISWRMIFWKCQPLFKGKSIVSHSAFLFPANYIHRQSGKDMFGRCYELGEVMLTK